MIIAVNGNIIDTKNIFKITPISKESEWDDNNSRMAKFFLIVMFNNITLEIYQQSHLIRTWNERTEPLPLHNTELLESIIKPEREASNIVFDKFRESIISVWSDNQSDIPQFNS
jgi:hypothetical protein